MSGDQHNQADGLCDGCDKVRPGIAGSPDGRSQFCPACMVRAFDWRDELQPMVESDEKGHFRPDSDLTDHEFWVRVRATCACGHLFGNHGRHGDHRAVTGCDGPPCSPPRERVSR